MLVARKVVQYLRPLSFGEPAFTRLTSTSRFLGGTIMNFATLGIDIAKATFQVALLRQDKLRHHTFANTEGGFAQLQAWLTKQSVGRLHACMEATAAYAEPLAHFLHQADHRVSIVNALRIKGFAQSQLQGNKTDKLDATIMARFCATQKPEAWTPPAPEIQRLQALLRRLQALLEMRQQESNRLEQADHQPIIGESVNKIIATLDAEMARLRQMIKDHIDQHPHLKRDHELLLSIPGIGQTTATWLLSEVQVHSYSSARQVAAHAGLTPRHHESGQHVGRRTPMSKTGNARLRRALYLPAVVANRHNPIIKAFCERLSQRGKRPMEIIGAAMRKLLHIVYGVLKSGKAFDPSFAS
jgi:transposase